MTATSNRIIISKKPTDPPRIQKPFFEEGSYQASTILD
jgi:hypothetical protein